MWWGWGWCKLGGGAGAMGARGAGPPEDGAEVAEGARAAGDGVVWEEAAGEGEDEDPDGGGDGPDKPAEAPGAEAS